MQENYIVGIYARLITLSCFMRSELTNGTHGTQARKGSSDTAQEIEIYFNFIGRFVPPDFAQEPTPEEEDIQKGVFIRIGDMPKKEPTFRKAAI